MQHHQQLLNYFFRSEKFQSYLPVQAASVFQSHPPDEAEGEFIILVQFNLQ